MLKTLECTTLAATNHHRKDWYVTARLVDERAVGNMYCGSRVVRENFSVKVRNGKFAVDIGTGSGVKVNFDFAR